MNTNDWACATHTLEVRDFKKRYRLGLAFNRFFVELDGDESQQRIAVSHATKLLGQAVEKMSSEIIQVGLRQFFALEVDGAKEAQLVKKLFKIFGSPEFIGVNVDDVSYTFEIDPRPDGMRGRVICGAMARGQWVQFAPSSHLKPLEIENIVQSLPEEFLFLDSDFIKVKSDDDAVIKLNDAVEFAQGQEKENISRARRLLRQVKG